MKTTAIKVVVVGDSRIQRIVLAAEVTTATKQVSHRPIKCQSRSWSQRGTKVNGSHHGGSPLLKPTSPQKPCPAQPTTNIGNLSASRRCLWVRTTVSTAVSGVLPVFQNRNCKLHSRLSGLLPDQQSHQKLRKRFSSSRRVTRRQAMRHFTGHGTDQCRNGSSDILIPYREQPRSTRIVVAYPRPAFSATKRTNHARTIFDQRAQVYEGRASDINREN